MLTSRSFLLAGTLVLGVVAALLLVPFSSADADTEEEPPSPEHHADSAAEATDAFGLPQDQYAITEGHVGPRETFSDLLDGHGLSYQDILHVARETRSTFDTRKIRSGDTYRLYHNPWLERPDYLVYQRDAVRYAVIDLQDPDASYTGERDVAATWTSTGGTIETSLYQTVVNNGGHADLVLELADIFAWQIDFFRVQSGDSFEILYEERELEGTSLSPGDVIAARFRHQGEDYYAFRFDEGSRISYFDERGNSLRRELLQAPLDYTRISSRFTQSRYHPILDEYRPHHGTDYAAPTGTPVRAVGDGTIEQAGYYGNNGNYVKIRHNSTYETGYLHLSRIEGGIRPGTEVEQGEVIGYVGQTGLATGPHLCYRLWKNGQPSDPYELDLPPSHPVYPQNLRAYDNLVQALKPHVNGAPTGHEAKPLHAAAPPVPSGEAGP